MATRDPTNDVTKPYATRVDGPDTKPAFSAAARKAGTASVIVRDGDLPEATTEEAAKVLVEHLFAQNDIVIPGISYAVSYRLSEGPTGGDIVDLYQYDNDSIAVSIADIFGKGPHAAINAALIKFGLRAYSSEGLTPERVMRAMDRLYLENNFFEKLESSFPQLSFSTSSIDMRCREVRRGRAPARRRAGTVKKVGPAPRT